MKNIRRIALGSVAGLTLAAGLAWGASFSTPAAFAQSDGQAQEQGAFFEMRGGKHGARGFGARGSGAHSSGQRGGVGQGLLLANALGVTPVQLQEANDAARKATIDQAAAAGVITAEQAAQINNGERPDGDFSGLRTYMADVDQDAALATALGITPEALTAAKDSQVQMGVEAGLITQEQGNQMLLRQKIQEATKAAIEQAIDEAVAEGLITQEEADAMKNGRGAGFGQERGGKRGNRGSGGQGFNGQGRGGNGGLFGGFDAAPDSAPSSPALNDA